MQPENFVDPIEFIKALNKEKIKFLLVGRQALVQYGAPLQSFDYDFYLDPDLNALKKLWKVTEDFGMEIEPSPPNKPEKLTLYADNLKVDIFRAKKYFLPDNTYLLFDEMYKNSSIFKGEKDFYIAVPSLEDLKKSKSIRNLPKDKEDIKYIEVLMEKYGKK